MNAPPQIFFVLSLTACFLCACAPEQALCAELNAQLRRCDLQAADFVCGAESYGTKQALLEELDERGCDALRVDGDVRPELCALFGWPCPEALVSEAGFIPRSPVLYVSGIDSTPAFDWSDTLLTSLGETGAIIEHVRLPPWAGVEARSLELARSVSRAASASPTGRVHLVCWAVGGIDCRYLISPGGLLSEDEGARQAMTDAIVSVTTLGTPHRGTYVASAALLAAETPGVDSAWAEFFGVREELSEFIDPSLLFDARGVRAQLYRLGPGEMLRFNERVIDAPGVMYQSFAGVSYAFGQPYAPDAGVVARDCTGASDPLLAWSGGTRDILSELLLGTVAHSTRHNIGEGETVSAASDGMIPVPSARWGTFRGCLPADHYDLVGQFHDIGADPNTGFDPRAFHLALLDSLADFERGASK